MWPRKSKGKYGDGCFDGGPMEAKDHYKSATLSETMLMKELHKRKDMGRFVRRTRAAAQATYGKNQHGAPLAMSQRGAES